MTIRIPEDQIESLVGTTRHATQHWARAVSDTQTVYILHPLNCREKNGLDLRYCPYSLALDRGIPEVGWAEHLDRAVRVAIQWNYLLPVREG